MEARRGVERDRQRDRAGGAAWGPNGAGAGSTAAVDRAGLDRRGRPIYQRGHQAFGGDRSARDARGAPTQPKRSRRPGLGVCLYALHALHARLFGRVGRVHSQRSAGATSSLSSRAALTGGVRAHAQAAAEAQRRPRDGKLLQPSAVSACVVAGSPTRARSLKHSGRGKAELREGERPNLPPEFRRWPWFSAGRAGAAGVRDADGRRAQACAGRHVGEGNLTPSRERQDKDSQRHQRHRLTPPGARAAAA